MPLNKELASVLEKELICQHVCETTGEKRKKDILVVVRNQLDYVRKCLESVRDNTRDYNLHVWNNASDEETTAWLTAFGDSLPPDVGWCIAHVPENMGFIGPNNEMAACCKSDWIILLNSDTEVREGWDTALIGWLEENPKYGIVGYEGGLVASNGVGVGVGHGDEIDYVAGWCLCMSRDLYKAIGLFDEKNLKFAYGEDLDLGLRAREAGLRSYALHLFYVKHHGNRTTNAVRHEMDLKPTFKANHEYIRTRWADFMKSGRTLLRHPQLEQEARKLLGECPMLDKTEQG